MFRSNSKKLTSPGFVARGPNLRLSPGSLTVGLTYDAKLIASVSGGSSESANVSIQVQPSALTGVIKVQGQTAGAHVLNADDGAAVLSGTGSFDPDDDSKLVGSSAKYQWACTTPSTAACTYVDGTTITPPTSASWTIQPATMTNGTVYTFNLTVSQGGRVGSVITRVNVRLSQGGAPSVVVTGFPRTNLN